MAKLTKLPNAAQLVEWGYDPRTTKIDYWDGRVLIVSDKNGESNTFIETAKLAFAVVGAMGLFSAAPAVSLVMLAYAASKGKEAIASIYSSQSTPDTYVAPPEDLDIYPGLSNVELSDTIASDPQDIVDNGSAAGFEAAYQNNQIPQVHPVTPAIAPAQETRVPAASEPINPAPIIQPSPVQAISQTPAIASIPPTIGWQAAPTQSLKGSGLDEIKEICDRNNSFFIVGSKGAGKGIFASNLLRWKLEQFPNAIVWMLDPKGDLKESGYWDHERIRRLSFKGMALRPAEYESKVIEYMAEARNLMSQCDIREGKRLFIVVDEFLAMKTKLSGTVFGELSSFATEAISLGDSEGIHFIGLTQSSNATDAVGSEEVIKNMCQVYVFRQDEFDRVKKNVKYGRVNADTFTKADFTALVSQSPVNRVVSVGGEFFPSPKMPNYSGYDRDSNSSVSQKKPMASKPEVDSAVIEKIAITLAETATPQAVSEVSRLRSAGDTKGAIAVLINGDDLQALQNRCKADPDSVKAIYEWVQN